MKYPITLKGEIRNGLLHLCLGFLIAYTMLPTSIFWIMLLVAGVYGMLRELFQFIREKEQPLYIIVIDVIGVALGSGIWYIIREIFNINADIL